MSLDGWLVGWLSSRFKYLILLKKIICVFYKEIINLIKCFYLRLENFYAGALSGFTVRFLTQPLDVLKIRFQVSCDINVHNDLVTSRTYKII